MNARRALEQERAADAWNQVNQVKEKGYSKEYGSLARSASANIMANGLGQTLAFWRAKGLDRGRPANNGENAHWQILSHVSDWVKKQLGFEHDDGLLGWIVEDAKTDQYRQATTETIAYLSWLKRFAEAELGAE
jgi:CRISPR-associated protein Cmr5